MKRGKFIVIDGGEGSGKTTMIAYAKKEFPDIVFTREPGGAPFAEKIRSIILSSDAKDADANTLFGLFWASRADHVKNLVIPSLENGHFVLCDRFDSSSYAYQIHGQENHHLKELFHVTRKVFLGNHVPDMYIYLDVVPEEGIRRKKAGQLFEMNHLDERETDFHKRVRQGYMEFLKLAPHVIIDANRPLEEVKKNFKEIFTKIVDNKRV